MRKILALATLLAPVSVARADHDNGFDAGVGMFNRKIDDAANVGSALGQFDDDDVPIKVSAGDASRLKTSDEDPAYAIGLSLPDHLATKLEYERIDNSKPDRSDALWLTAAWRF